MSSRRAHLLPGSSPARAAPGGLITCRPAVSPGELQAHHAIRHQVFVLEQDLFPGSDRDPHDDQPGTVRLLGCYDRAPAGAVRLFELDASRRLWQGDRLCVLPPYRVRGLGAPLVRCAVAMAGARGGAQMVAHIQLQNVTFFTHLGWRPEGGTEIYAGVAHQPMIIDLPGQADAAGTERELSDGIVS